MKLSRGQLAVLHVAKKQLGLDDDVYRDVLESAAGVRSAKELTPASFRAVMSRFEELGFQGTKHVRRPRSAAKPDERNPDALVTGRQLAYLRHLFDEVGMDTLRRQAGFCERVCGRPWPQTRREASRCIEALKGMTERRYDAGPRRSS